MNRASVSINRSESRGFDRKYSRRIPRDPYVVVGSRFRFPCLNSRESSSSSTSGSNVVGNGSQVDRDGRRLVLSVDTNEPTQRNDVYKLAGGSIFHHVVFIMSRLTFTSVRFGVLCRFDRSLASSQAGTASETISSAWKQSQLLLPACFRRVRYFALATSIRASERALHQK